MAMMKRADIIYDQFMKLSIETMHGSGQQMLVHLLCLLLSEVFNANGIGNQIRRGYLVYYTDTVYIISEHLWIKSGKTYDPNSDIDGLADVELIEDLEKSPAIAVISVIPEYSIDGEINLYKKDKTQYRDSIPLVWKACAKQWPKINSMKCLASVSACALERLYHRPDLTGYYKFGFPRNSGDSDLITRALKKHLLSRFKVKLVKVSSAMHKDMEEDPIQKPIKLDASSIDGIQEIVHKRKIISISIHLIVSPDLDHIGDTPSLYFIWSPNHAHEVKSDMYTFRILSDQNRLIGRSSGHIILNMPLSWFTPAASIEKK